MPSQPDTATSPQRKPLLAGLPGQLVGWFATLIFWAVTLAVTWNMSDADKEQPSLWLATLMLLVPLAGAMASAELSQGFTLPGSPWPARTHRWLIGAVLLFGAFLRLYNLGELPNYIDPDSAQNGFTSMILSGELLQRGEFKAVLHRWALGNEAAFLYLLGLFQRVLGVGPGSLRLPGALAGLATIYALYRLGTELFSRRLGLVAAAMLALSPWHIYLCRLPKRPILTPLFMALALLFLARVLRAPTLRRGLPALVGCGLCLGMGLHGYEAFHLVPLVVTVALLSVRLSGHAPGRGLAELGVIAGVSALVSLPIILFAMDHPEVYFHHVTSAALGHHGGSSVTAFLTNAVVALQYFFCFLPGNQNGGLLQASIPVLPSGLCLLGLGALTLSSRQGLKLAPGARPILFGSMAVMLLILLFTEHQLAPRRPIGLLVPYFLLAAGVALSLARALVLRLPRHLAAIPALLFGVLLLLPLPSFFSELGNLDRDRQQEGMTRLMRWVSQQATEREVYLAPSVRDKHQLVLFYLHHKNIHRLPTFEPLPQGALKLETDALLVALTEQWRGALTRLYGPGVRPVPLPKDVSGWIQATAYLVPRQAIRALRLPPEHLTSAFKGWLMAPATGEYRFSAATHGARLVLDGSPPMNLSNRGIQRILTAGLHRIHYSPGPGGARLQWRGEHDLQDHPVPAGALWSAEIKPSIPAPGMRPNTIQLGHRSGAEAWFEPITFGSPQEGHSFQDLTQRGETYYFLDAGLNRLQTWSSSHGAGEALPLRTSDGRPFGSMFHSTVDRMLYQTLNHAFRISAGDQGFYLLDLVGKSIHRFTPMGVLRDRLPLMLDQPTDLASGEEELYISDMGWQAVLAMPLAPGQPLQRRIQGVRPVALDYSSSRLALLDMGLHSLSFHNAHDGVLQRRLALGRVGPMSTLALDATGHVLITQRRKDRETARPDRTWIFNRDGAMLSMHADPNQLSVALRARGMERMQAMDLDLARGRIVVLCEWTAGVGELRLRVGGP